MKLPETNVKRDKIFESPTPTEFSKEREILTIVKLQEFSSIDSHLLKYNINYNVKCYI
jgi:hypothetical protein